MGITQRIAGDDIDPANGWAVWMSCRPWLAIID
jgi:hypothetical protein